MDSFRNDSRENDSRERSSCAHLLMDYASGTLDRELSLMVAAHLALSRQARDFVGFCEALGGALLETQCAPVGMIPDSLGAVLSRIDRQEPEEACARKNRQLSPVLGFELPAPLHRQVEGRERAWKVLWPGIRIMNLPPAGSGESCRLSLVAAKPGGRIPRPVSRVFRMALVLDGRLADRGLIHEKGSLLSLEDEPLTDPVADSDRGCMLLVSRSPADPPPSRRRIVFRMLVRR